MSDTVLIPFQGELLALDRATFDEARQRGRDLMPSPTTLSPTVTLAEILDAEGMQARTGIPASWFLEQARRNAIPHLRAGKYVRFSVADVLAALSNGKREDFKAAEPIRLRRRSA